MKSPQHCVSSFYMALCLLNSQVFFAQEDDHEFASPDGWSWLSETGEDDASWRPAEGFLGHHFEPLKDRMIEPVDGDGGFDNVAPQLAVEEGPGGLEWDVSPTYRTLYKGGIEYPAGSGTRLQGNNWFMRMPYAIYVSASNQWRLRFDASTFRVFTYYYTDASSQQHYLGSYGTNNNELVWNSSLGEVKLYDIRGKIYTFSNSAGYRLTKIQGRGTNQITITYGGSSITVLQKPTATAGSEVRRFIYTIASNRIDKIDIEEKVGGIWRRYRKIDFTYHENVTGAVESTTGDLIGIEEFTRLSINCVDNPGPCDPGTTPGAWISRKWVFKYWTSVNYSEPGYRYQVRAVLGPQSVEDWESNPAHSGLIYTHSTTGTLTDYIDRNFSYDFNKRLNQLVLKGDCGCGGGSGSYSYSWALNGTTPSNLNTWWRQVTITMPSENGSSRIIDYNKYGQRLNYVVQEVGGSQRRWIETWRHNTSGFLTDSYSVAACGPNSYSDSTHVVTPVEPSFRGGLHFQFTSSSNNSLGTVKLRDPANSNWNFQLKKVFTNQTSGDRRLLLKTSEKVYPTQTTIDTGGIETLFGYNYHSADVLAVKKRTITLPAVPTNQNGSGYPTINKDLFDLDGVKTWQRISHDHNNDGTPDELVVNHTAYDPQRRTVVMHIVDINTSDAQMPDPPTGETDFQTTTGLSVVTEYEYDSLRRPIKQINPEFNAWTGSAIELSSQTQHWYYTKLIGGEYVTVAYAHMDASYFNHPISLSVQDFEGHTITSAQGVLAGGYRDTDLSNDIDTSQATIDAAFKWGAQNRGVLVSRTDQTFEGSNVAKQEVWSEASNGTLPKYTTEYTFDSAGRKILQKTHAPGQPDPAPTIRRWSYDVLNRVKSEKLGTVDGGGGDNMTIIEEQFYDHEEESAGYVGDGNTTQVRRYTENGGAARITDYDYDYRSRLIQIDGPLPVRDVYTYTNQNQRSIKLRYDTSIGTVLKAQHENLYDVLGNVFRAREYGVPLADSNSDGTYDHGKVEFWYNARGLVIKKLSGGKVFNKTQYDGAGRTINQAVSYEAGESSYAAALDLAGDTVISETRYVIDGTGKTELSRTYQRKHGASGTGGLTIGVSGNGRPSFVATWYDKLNRPTHSVAYGTDGGAVDMTTRPTGNPPSISTAEELVTMYGYYLEGDTYKGQVLGQEGSEAIGTDGITTFTQSDDAGHVIKTVENIVDWAPNANDDDRTIEYGYDPRGRLHKTIVKASGADQVTENVYGVSQGVDQSKISSNELLYKIKHPDPATGQPGSLGIDQEVFGYNAQGEVVWKRDQAGTAHTLDYDDRGRLIHDRVTAIGNGVDQAVRRISQTYDALDRPSSVTSHDNKDAGLGNTLNEVLYQYGKYNTLSSLTQNWGPGAGSKVVQFQYQLPVNGTTGVRRTSTTYPDGTVVTHEYDVGMDDTLNRVSGKKKQSAWVYKDSHIGLGKLVERQYGDAALNTKWTLIGATAENGDYYSGLDTFGRIDKLIAKKNATEINSYEYQYNARSQTEFKIDLLGNELDQKYTYDSLERVVDHQRGEYASGGMSPLKLHECWTLDRSGNRTSYYTGTSATCGSTHTAIFNKSNEITTTSMGTWTYDHQGDLTRQASKSFKYDAWNRLVLVWDNSLLVDLSEYEYNGLNQRIKRTESAVLQPDLYYYYNDKSQLIQENLVSNGATNNLYVWGEQHIDDLVQRGPNTEYYVLDATGDVVTRLDGNGDVFRRHVYDAYGNPRQLSADWLTWQSITEDLHLSKSRLWVISHGHYDNRMRAYDRMGIFMQPDPLGALGDAANFGNTRLFVGNDPINRWDPSGLMGLAGGEWPQTECEQQWWHMVQMAKARTLPQGAQWPLCWGTMGAKVVSGNDLAARSGTDADYINWLTGRSGGGGVRSGPAIRQGVAAANPGDIPDNIFPQAGGSTCTVELCSRGIIGGINHMYVQYTVSGTTYTFGLYPAKGTDGVNYGVKCINAADDVGGNCQACESTCTVPDTFRRILQEFSKYPPVQYHLLQANSNTFATWLMNRVCPGFVRDEDILGATPAAQGASAQVSHAPVAAAAARKACSGSK